LTDQHVVTEGGPDCTRGGPSRSRADRRWQTLRELYMTNHSRGHRRPAHGKGPVAACARGSDPGGRVWW
jgi:hypothetical protein